VRLAVFLTTGETFFIASRATPPVIPLTLSCALLAPGPESFSSPRFFPFTVHFYLPCGLTRFKQGILPLSSFLHFFFQSSSLSFSYIKAFFLASLGDFGVLGLLPPPHRDRRSPGFFSLTPPFFSSTPPSSPPYSFFFFIERLLESPLPPPGVFTRSWFY